MNVTPVPSVFVESVANAPACSFRVHLRRTEVLAMALSIVSHRKGRPAIPVREGVHDAGRWEENGKLSNWISNDP